MAKIFREDTPPKLLTKRKFIVACLILTLIAIGVFAAISLSSNFGGGRTIVCGDELVFRYNTALKAGSKEQYDKELETVAKEVLELPARDKDPTCSAILYTYYVSKQDIVNAGAAADAYARENGNEKIDEAVVNPPSEDRMRQYIESHQEGAPNLSGGEG